MPKGQPKRKPCSFLFNLHTYCEHILRSKNLFMETFFFFRSLVHSKHITYSNQFSTSERNILNLHYNIQTNIVQFSLSFPHLHQYLQFFCVFSMTHLQSKLKKTKHFVHRCCTNRAAIPSSNQYIAMIRKKINKARITIAEVCTVHCINRHLSFKLNTFHDNRFHSS
jgi:hypothetical protein